MFVFAARRLLVFTLMISLAGWPAGAQDSAELAEDHSQEDHSQEDHSQEDHSQHSHAQEGHAEQQQMPRPSEEGRDLARLKKEIPPPSEQNLDFEDGETAAPWILGGRGYSLELDSEVAQSGRRSLRIRYEQNGRFAVASLPFDAKTVLGKRIRLTGYLKSEEIAQGHAGLWMRVDAGHRMAAFDNMDRRGVSGTSPWTQYTIEFDVPEDATRIFYGAVLTGIGTVWVDNLKIEAEVLPPVKHFALSGKVMGSEGRPLGNTHVALSATAQLAPHSQETLPELRTTRTETNGSFTFEQVPQGQYQLTASSSSGFAIAEALELDGRAEPQILELGEKGATVSGRVLGLDGKPALNADLEISVGSQDKVHIFAARTDDQGEYRVRVPKHDWVHVRWLQDAALAVGRALGSSDESDSVVNLRAIQRGVPRKGTIADFVAGSIVLATTHPNQPVGELEDVGEIIGNARVVALGESSPGTREIFELKNRLVQLLTTQLGFTGLALPLSAEDGRKLHDFVQSGHGEARKILHGLDPWGWRTWEALDFVEVLRQLETSGQTFEIFGYGPELSPAEQSAAIQKRLAASPDSKLIVWTDNRSAARGPLGFTSLGFTSLDLASGGQASGGQASGGQASMGRLLAEEFGDQYLAMGGFFSQGAFLADSPTPDETPKRFWLAPPSKEHLDYLFVQMGGKLGIHDLRHFETGGEVDRWLSVPRPIRDIGVAYGGEKASELSIVLTDEFDAFLFVESTTQSRMLD